MALKAHELKEGVSYLNTVQGMIPIHPGSVIIADEEDTARNLTNANGVWDLEGKPVATKETGKKPVATKEK